MGREGNTLNFPDDRFISGHHARLDAHSDSQEVMLTDTGSRNGTFIRLEGAQELFHGDYLFVGQGTAEAEGRMGERCLALHQALEKHNIEHEYYTGGYGGHDWATWRHLLYHRFLPNLWRED